MTRPAASSGSSLRRSRSATFAGRDARPGCLSDVSERSRIPVSLLRQLEWGYLYNWPGGLYGRTQLIRYARAAGLDDALVVSTLTPLLDEMGQVSPPAVEPTATPATAPLSQPTEIPQITVVDLEGFEPEFAEEPELAPEPLDTREQEPAALVLAQPFSEGEILIDIDEAIVVDESIGARELFSQTVDAAASRRSRVIPAMAAAAAIALAALGGYWSQNARPSSSPASQTARVGNAIGPSSGHGTSAVSCGARGDAGCSPTLDPRRARPTADPFRRAPPRPLRSLDNGRRSRWQ